MPFPALFGISVTFGLAVWGAVAWHYIWPGLRELRSPETAFSQPVACDDLISAVLALLALAPWETAPLAQM